MSFGNSGGKSKSQTNESNTQATNYGRDQVTAATGKGDVNVSTRVEDLSDEALTSVLDFAGESQELTARSFNELIGFTADQSARKDEQVDSALGTVQAIAKDKATGVQSAQRMTVYAVAGVIIAVIAFAPRRSKAA